MQQVNGLLSIGESNNDFLYEGNIRLPNLEKMDNKRFEYNQSARQETVFDCTLFASFGAISDMFNYELTESDIDEIVKMSRDRGKKQHMGRYMKDAVECVSDRRNAKNKDKKVTYWRVILDSPFAKEAMQKNYTMVAGVTVDGGFYRDSQDDGILSITKNETNDLFGHCISIIANDVGDFCVKDSYIGRQKYNIFKIDNLDNVVDGGMFDKFAYLYMPTTAFKLDKTKEIMKKITKINETIKKNSEARHQTRNKSLKEELHQENNRLREQVLDLQKQI